MPGRLSPVSKLGTDVPLLGDSQIASDNVVARALCLSFAALENMKMTSVQWAKGTAKDYDGGIWFLHALVSVVTVRAVEGCGWSRAWVLAK